MQGWHDATQIILQILRDPAWSGVAGICALLGIPLAFLLARKSKISRTQASNKNQARKPAQSNGTRLFIRNGYHRAFLAQELVKDIDVIDSTNLNRYLSPLIKN